VGLWRAASDRIKRGFTLIELLIVVAIIGVAFGGLKGRFNAWW